ncbi:sulfotransferase [Thioalkalicoccus limnaeus]|uniref:Sulfotransferase n=1 Tax=Thioalkalicoccus limnaeus TaxID=120681 RepID=A0ABV4BF81_9GAMM
MPSLFVATSFRILRSLVASLRPARHGGRFSWRHVLVLAGFLPLFLVMQGIHWLGFLLDELLFRGYRRVEIREPLFILGVPRSGTTHLHRVLAKDPQFTTFSTWECLFALSVTERRIWLALARVDRFVGSPAARLLNRIENLVFGHLDGVHPMRLQDPEEDYFSLTPVLACFILVLAFPHLAWIWRMGTFDRDMPAADRQRLLDFYESNLKRHLYVHGQDKRLLSKNAAFAPLAGSLVERFPDARFIVCLRAPAETLPSQLSSLRAGLDLFDVERVLPDFQDRLLAQLAFYYENLHQALASLPPERRAWIEMRALGPDLIHTVDQVYERLGLTSGPVFRYHLAQAQRDAKGYRSRHRYDAGQVGLTSAQIRERFDPLYQRFDRALARPGTPPGLAREAAEGMDVTHRPEYSNRGNA